MLLTHTFSSWGRLNALSHMVHLNLRSHSWLHGEDKKVSTMMTCGYKWTLLVIDMASQGACIRGNLAAHMTTMLARAFHMYALHVLLQAGHAL